MDKLLGSRLLCKLFQTLFESQVCLRCILRVLRIENLQVYRDKQGYSEILIKVGNVLGDDELLLKNYDFLNYCQKQNFSQNLFDENQTNYRLPSSMRDQQIQNPTLILPNKQFDCIVCMGILQIIDSQQFLKQVFDKLNTDDYEFENFKFTVKTPYACQVRQLMSVYNAIETTKQWAQQNNIEESHDTLTFYQLQTATVDLKVVIKWIMSSLLSEQLGKRSDANDDRFNINLIFENIQDDFKQFLLFQHTVESTDEQNWQEKITKKLKMNDGELRQQTQQRLQEKRQQQPQFAPSQNNLDKIQKIPMSYVVEEIMNKQYPQKNHYEIKVEVKAIYQNILIKGNYIKLARFLSQTPWMYRDVKQYENSISEIIEAPCQNIFRGTSVKFHSGGREDVDVRMLGEGRPFVIEIIDPHRGFSTINQESTDYIFKEVNKSTQVNVSQLNFTDFTSFLELKNSEINKIKAYCCLVQSSKVVEQDLIMNANSIKDLKIDQKTPIRVLHRRTLLNRQKTIHKLKIKRINCQFFLVYVLASAGTYIKEFIHSDLERTKPSLCDLFECDCDIFQLDVVKLYPECNEEALKDFEQISQ